jgi:molybdopterin/thiamine biosynthesis adenylyltransferase
MTNENPFIIDDDDRYSQMRLIGWWDQEKLSNAKVMVVGLGALGNEVAKNLTLTGVGAIVGVDMDHIEDSNLTRSVLFRKTDNGKSKVEAAASALYDLNPDTRFHAIHGNVMTEIGLGLVRDVDVVIGCLDNREARLWVNRMCWKVGTPWVDGGIQEVSGVVKVFVPPFSACYECAMTENDYRMINLRYSCPLLKREDILEGKVPTAPTISSMIAGLQTQEALKLIHEMPVEEGVAMVFNGIANNFYKTKFQRKEDCLSHDVYGDLEKSGLSTQSRIKEIFDFARTRVSGSGLSIQLDRDLVESIYCPACDEKEEVFLPLSVVGSSKAMCVKCKINRRPKLTHRIDETSQLLERTASEVGIPAYDVVRVCSDSHEVFVELDEDQDQVMGHPYREER